MTSPISNHASNGRLGSHRPLTNLELANWQRTAQTWTSTPPWTPRVLDDNRQVMTMLVALYEDGVALPTIGRAAGWGYPRTNGILHRARDLQLTTGTRRYIPTAGEQAHATKTYRYRNLTDQEHVTLVDAWTALPCTAHTKSWKNPAGLALLDKVEQILAGGVSLAKIAAVFSKTPPVQSPGRTPAAVSRQALHQQLMAHRNR